ncbi:response regulator [Spartinivicinus poritis]|uniref:Response regulator n=1 Tax=Spartinivicinus poritis TaxID=2994640 RepID=A0ABT5U8Y8_9GAMM|nr:response regulator [Spartinivicinus sp. A2-2]MDE1462830.1 response regulator [Spartinivicinus sp. A2-2]
MANLNIPIMVVDDAKFSSVMIGRTLKGAGFRDIRFASSANEALVQLQKRPASILVADWLMPEMDGLQLTQQVRELDKRLHHFTYVILLTAKEGVKALAEAFDRGVDDFINKSVMNDQLLPRIFAADRTAHMQNQLLEENKLLVDNLQQLEKHSLTDHLTGIGNLRFCLNHLSEAIRHVESRDASACLLVIALQNAKQIEQQRGLAIYNEVAKGVARRLQQLIRPLDIITRTGDDQFSIITTHLHDEQYTPKSFRRIYEGLNLKAFKSSVGYISIKAAMSMCILTNTPPLPTAEQLLVVTRKMLQKSLETGLITATQWNPGMLKKKPPQSEATS